MPSSISSSERPVPDRPWSAILVAVVLATAALTAGWELYWRSVGFVAREYMDTPAIWASQRSRATRGRTVRTWTHIEYSDNTHAATRHVYSDQTTPQSA